MGIIDVLVMLFFTIGLVLVYLVIGMLWADRQSNTTTGNQSLRVFLLAVSTGYAWPVSVFKWVWSKVRKTSTT